MSDLWSLRFAGSEHLPMLSRDVAGKNGGRDSGPSANLENLLKLGTRGANASTGVKDTIDVINQFNWTRSPISSRADTPFISLKENRIVMNSTVQNLIYSATASVDTIGSVGTTAFAGIESIIDQFKPKKGETTQSGSGAEVQDEQDQQESVNEKGKNKLLEMYDKAVEASYYKKFNNPALKPYQGLYALEPTGFHYRFPYLDDTYGEVNTQFGEDTGNIAGELTNIAGSIATGAAGIANVLRPGTYIEKSKQFQMQDLGRAINFRFPLLNTMNAADVSRNWQLIYGLIYQNRPGRVSKSIIDQPVIYEVSIPGVAYMPYAFIQRFSVRFLGNRRLMEIDVPIFDENDNQVTNITTTVPDAYEVEITVQGLNDETRNMLYANISKSKLTVNKAE